MHDRERGSFYASLPDGEYRLADIPHLKERWLEGTLNPRPALDSGADPTPAGSPPVAGSVVTHDVRVIVRSGKLAGIRVGDGEPTMAFARSRDFEHKWTDQEPGAGTTRTLG
jgi:hypothetical protein